jgi:hypothetical protein
MAVITTKIVFAPAFTAAASAASVIGYQTNRTEQHTATAHMATTASQFPVGPDWRMQWYDAHRAVRDNAPDSVAVPTYQGVGNFLKRIPLRRINIPRITVTLGISDFKA